MQSHPMTSFRGRLQLAEAAAVEAAQENPLERDPFYLILSRLKGKVDSYDGFEYVQAQQIADVLEIPTSARTSALWRRITKLMVGQEPPWEPIRIRSSNTGCNISDRIRGFRRKCDRLPIPKDLPTGKCQTDTPYIIGKVVSRLEMDSRFALARSVRALVAERDRLLEQLGAQ